MSGYQALVIIVCVFIFLFDGFDVAVIAFASNPLAEYFQLNEEALGLLLGLDYVGVVLGSVVIAPLSDRFGRRSVLLVNLAVLAVGVYCTSLANDVYVFAIFRQISGLAAGAILPIALSLGNESVFSPKHKNVTVALLTLSGPFGGIIAGAATNILAPQYGWQSIFVFGGIMLGVIFIVSWLVLPHSVEFLSKRRAEGDLERVNKIRRKMKVEELDALPEIETDTKVGVKGILSAQYLRSSVLLWVVFSLLMFSLQFIFKWTPKILTKQGMEMLDANKITMGLILGGIVGIIFMGRMSSRYPLKNLVAGAFIFGALVSIGFVSVGTTFGLLFGFAFLVGSSLQACYAGMNISAMRIYDTQARSTGTGWMMGIGKIGGILGPMVAGVLFGAGYGKFAVVILLFVVPFILGAMIYRMIQAREITKSVQEK